MKISLILSLQFCFCFASTGAQRISSQRIRTYPAQEEDDFIDDDDDDEGGGKKKKPASKKAKPAAAGGDDHLICELGNNRRVSVSTFKGKASSLALLSPSLSPSILSMLELVTHKSTRHALLRAQAYVNIREYYEKDGQQLPGKKGIALTAEQFELLKASVGAVSEELAKHA